MSRRILTWTMALMLAAGSAAGQTKTGTTIGQFLLIEPSARLAGMGNAGVSAWEGLDATYYNPAVIGLLGGTNVQFTHSAWLADITYDYVAVALPAGRWGNFTGSLTALNSGDIAVRTVEQPLGTGERYSVSDVALGLGYGRQITDRFAAGLRSGTLVNLTFDEMRARSPLFMPNQEREDGHQTGRYRNNSCLFCRIPQRSD